MKSKCCRKHLLPSRTETGSERRARRISRGLEASSTSIDPPQCSEVTRPHFSVFCPDSALSFVPLCGRVWAMVAQRRRGSGAKGRLQTHTAGGGYLPLFVATAILVNGATKAKVKTAPLTSLQL
eukprot:m.430389 g.430389  ORF g.430389 m.430389 type:complete len:124 (-) comp17156_c0_seq1:55-426(-)